MEAGLRGGLASRRRVDQWARPYASRFGSGPRVTCLWEPFRLWERTFLEGQSLVLWASAVTNREVTRLSLYAHAF